MFSISINPFRQDNAVGSQRSSIHKIRCTYGFLSGVPTGRVIFEIWGAPKPPIREEMARDGKVVLLPCRISANCPAALRQAGDKLPMTMKFIDRKTPSLPGNLLLTPEVNDRLDSSSTLISSWHTVTVYVVERLGAYRSRLA